MTNTTGQKVSLQINWAPPDFPLVKYMTPHQIRAFGSQVDEIVLSIETRPGKGRFAALWDRHLADLFEFANGLQANNKSIKFIEIDYSRHAREQVADLFFGGEIPPFKDFRGGPLYSYFYGLFSCRSDYVIHLDSDIFIGGADKGWIRQSLSHLEDRKIFTPKPFSWTSHRRWVHTSEYALS